MSYPSIDLLLPHERPMRLLDSVARADATSITCLYTIAHDCPFLEDGRVDVLVCVELIAQTVSAYTGMRMRQRGLPPKVGFFVRCRNADFFEGQLREGDELEITTEHLWGEEPYARFRGHV